MGGAFSTRKKNEKTKKKGHQDDKKNAAPSVVVPIVASPMVNSPMVTSPMVTSPMAASSMAARPMVASPIYANHPSDPNHDLDVLFTEVIQAMRKFTETERFSAASFSLLADQARNIIAEKRRNLSTEAQPPSNLTENRNDEP
tara:strand:+ start:87 stop:515 length:429 start_codon:yes stop_codon:yes gene_type:complete